MDQEKCIKKEDGIKSDANHGTIKILFNFTRKKISTNKIRNVNDERMVLRPRKRKNSAESPIDPTETSKQRIKQDSEDNMNIKDKHMVKTCSVLHFDKVKIHIDCVEISRHRVGKESKAFHELLEKQFMCQTESCSFSQFNKERCFTLERCNKDVVDHLRRLNIKEGSTEKEHTTFSLLSGKPPSILFSTTVPASGAYLLCQRLKIFSTDYSLTLCSFHRFKLGIDYKPESKYSYPYHRAFPRGKSVIGDLENNELERKNYEKDIDKYATILTRLKEEIKLVEENKMVKDYRIKENYEKNMFNINATLKGLNENIEDKEMERKKYEKDIVSYKYILTNLKEEIKKKEIERYNYEKDTIEYKIILTNMKKEIKLLDEIEKERKEKMQENCEKDFIKCETMLTSLKEEIEKKEIEWKNYERDIIGYATVLTNLIEEIEKKEKEQKTYGKNIATDEIKLTRLKDEIEKKEIEWKNYERDVIGYTTVLTKLIEEIEKKEKEQKHYGTNIATYEIKLTRLKDEIENNVKKKNNYEKDIVRYETLITKLKEEIEMKEIERNNYEKDIVTYEFMLTSLKEEIEKKEIEMKINEKHIIKYATMLTSLKEELEKKVVEREIYEKDIVAYERTIATLKEEIEIENSRIENSKMMLESQCSFNVEKGENVQSVYYDRENGIYFIGYDNPSCTDDKVSKVAKKIDMSSVSISTTNTLDSSLSETKIMQKLPKPIEEPNCGIIYPGLINTRTALQESMGPEYKVYDGPEGQFFVIRGKDIQATPEDVNNISDAEKHIFTGVTPGQQESGTVLSLPVDRRNQFQPYLIGGANIDKSHNTQLASGVVVSGVQHPNSISLTRKPQYLNSAATCQQKISSLDLIRNKSYVVQSIQGNSSNNTSKISSMGKEINTGVMSDSIISLPGSPGTQQQPYFITGCNISTGQEAQLTSGEVVNGDQHLNSVSSAGQSLHQNYNNTAPSIQSYFSPTCLREVNSLDLLRNESHTVQSVQTTSSNNVAPKSFVDKQIITGVIPGQQMVDTVISLPVELGNQQQPCLIEGNISRKHKTHLTSGAAVNGVQNLNSVSLVGIPLHTNSAAIEPILQSFSCTTSPQKVSSLDAFRNKNHMVQSIQADPIINVTKISGADRQINGVMPGQQMNGTVESLPGGNPHQPYLIGGGNIGKSHKTQLASEAVVTGECFNQISSVGQSLHLNSDTTLPNLQSVFCNTSTQKVSSLNLLRNRSWDVQCIKANHSNNHQRPQKMIPEGHFTSSDIRNSTANITAHGGKNPILSYTTQPSFQQNTQVTGHENQLFQEIRFTDFPQVAERIPPRTQQVKAEEISLQKGTSTALDITKPDINTPNVSPAAQSNLQRTTQIREKQKSCMLDNNKQVISNQMVTPVNYHATTKCICGFPGNWYDHMLEC